MEKSQATMRLPSLAFASNAVDDIFAWFYPSFDVCKFMALKCASNDMPQSGSGVDLTHFQLQLGVVLVYGPVRKSQVPGEIESRRRRRVVNLQH
jgi:hypothetical protein